MEFFVFLEGTPIIQGFTISYTETNVTVGDVIAKFLSVVKSADSNIQLDASKCKLFLVDYTDPIESKDPTLIADMNTPIMSLGTTDFDLILAEYAPIPDLYLELDSEGETDTESKFDKLIQQGKNYYAIKDYQCAFQIFLHASQANKDSPIPYQYQIKIYLKAKRYKSAISLATGNLNKFPEDRAILKLLAKAHQLSGNYNDAISYYKRLLLLPPKTQQNVDDISCNIARNLIETGAYDQAMSLLQPIATNNPTNLKASILMSQTLYHQGRVYDALHTAMQSFTIDPFHKATCEFIGNSVKNEIQSVILRSELGDGMNDPKVLFIIGNILHTHGSCEIARSYLKDSLDICPNDPSIALIYLENTLCISDSVISVLDSAMPFINRIMERQDFFADVAKKTDFIHLVNSLKIQETKEEKQEVPQNENTEPKEQPESTESKDKKIDISKPEPNQEKADTEAQKQEQNAPEAQSAEQNTDKSKEEQKQPEDPQIAIIEKSIEQIQPLDPVEFENKEHSFHMEQLDVFWYFIVLQYTLFTNGYIKTAQSISEAILPNITEFNFTRSVINQEIPTFGLISSLSKSFSDDIIIERPIYFIGDSNCLTLSYRNLTIDGVKRSILPLFVDGLSVTKLQEKSPTSVLFWKNVNKIPENSDVILSIGYIDCYQRIFSKISRVEFDSFTDGFIALSAMISNIATDIATKRNCRVFIHPIPPTGLESPLYAQAFNECISKKVLEINKPNVSFLSFFQHLIEADGKDVKVKKQYVFDGTHLNVTYLPFLEYALNNAMKSDL